MPGLNIFLIDSDLKLHTGHSWVLVLLKPISSCWDLDLSRVPIPPFPSAPLFRGLDRLSHRSIPLYHEVTLPVAYDRIVLKNDENSCVRFDLLIDVYTNVYNIQHK
ncbi:hypothetical protein DPMN_152618 [Dreissena polymorpha]|uniref:Uncharacterized protein n=1 Tax=Dreissena polymorpha TaxID=45954 RepID=A0A9D4FH54_DREPO|nr:hypothetical protein DPMN_152618 [Dreissena polymorpha]